MANFIKLILNVILSYEMTFLYFEIFPNFPIFLKLLAKINVLLNQIGFTTRKKKSVFLGPKKIVLWFLQHVYCRAESSLETTVLAHTERNNTYVHCASVESALSQFYESADSTDTQSKGNLPYERKIAFSTFYGRFLNTIGITVIVWL